MGVKHLWEIIGPAGRTVKLESLENRRLAIDTSIWLNHFIKAMRDNKGEMVSNAHVKGLFSRICKMLFFGVRPVFVLDGPAPPLKKMTTARRQRTKETSSKKVQQLAEKILLNQLQLESLKELKKSIANGDKDTAKRLLDKLTSPGSSAVGNPRQGDDDDVEIIDLDDNNEDNNGPIPLSEFVDDGEFAGLFGSDDEGVEAVEIPDSDEEDGSDDDAGFWADQSRPKLAISDEDLRRMNIDSEVFSALPEQMKFEVLSQLRQFQQTQRRSRVRQMLREGDLEARPDPHAFSDLQLNNLIQRSKVTRKIQELTKNLNSTAKQPIASNPKASYILHRDEAGPAGIKRPDGSIIRMRRDGTIETISAENAAAQSSIAAPVSVAPRAEATSSNQGNVVIDLINDFDIPSEEESSSSIEEIAEAIEIPDDSDDEKRRDNNDGTVEYVSERPATGAVLDIVIDTNAPVGEALDLERFFDAENGINSGDDNEFADVAFEDEAVAPESSVLDSNRIGISEDENDTPVSNAEVVLKSPPKAVPAGEDSPRPLKVPASPPPSSMVSAPPTFATEMTSAGEQNEIQIHRAPEPAPSRVRETPVPAPSTLEIAPPKFDTAPKDAQAAQNQHPIPVVSSSVAAQHAEPVKTPDASSCVLPDASVPMQVSHNIQVVAMPAAAPAPVDSPPVHLTASTPLATNVDASISENDHAMIEEDVSLNESFSSVVMTGSKPAASSAGSDAGLTDLLNRSIQSVSEEVWPEHVETMERELEAEVDRMQTQRRAQAGQAQNVTNEMVEDCKELLQLFGIPFVESPGEADAQCVILEKLGLVDGIVSDDSDIFVFGGKYVFRHAFDRRYHLELFQSSDIESALGLTQSELISLALLLGSDYTDGLRGIGPVSAKDIVGQFKGIDGLKHFRDWIVNGTEHGLNDKSREWYRQHKTLRQKIKALDQYFPSGEVIQAYLNPLVDPSTEAFEWNCPNLDTLRDYCFKKFGWEPQQTDNQVLPIVQRYNRTLTVTQRKIETFFLPLMRQEKSALKAKKPNPIPSAKKSAKKKTPKKKKASSRDKIVEQDDDLDEEHPMEPPQQATAPAAPEPAVNLEFFGADEDVRIAEEQDDFPKRGAAAHKKRLRAPVPKVTKKREIPESDNDDDFELEFFSDNDDIFLPAGDESPAKRRKL